MKNKLSFLVVFLVLLSVISISASALNIKEGNIKVDIPSEYTCVTKDNIDQNLPLLNEMKFTRNDFEKHLKENKIILFARNGQKDEIIIKLDEAVWSEEFDIDLLDADAFQKIAVSLSSGLDYEKVTLGENVFVRTNLVGKDSGGHFSVIRYVTVQKGNLISVEFLFDGNVNNDKITFTEGVVASLDLPKSSDNFSKASDGVNDIVVKGLIILAIIAGVGVCVYIAITIVRDIRDKRNTNDVAPYVKIKRRKF